MTSDLLLPTRRGLLSGLGLLLAAPAIVRASSLMPVKTLPEELETSFYEAYGWQPLTIAQINKQAVELFKQSNAFLKQIDQQYYEINQKVRIRLPHQKD